MPRKSGLAPIKTQKAFPLARAFTFVESGPVLLVTTCFKGQPNVLTVSCHASLGFEPTIGLALGPWNHSYEALVETGECVVAIPSVDLLETTVAIGNVSGAEVDKFKAFNLATQKATLVKAPLLSDCFRNLECRVVEWLKKRHFFILKGVKAWQNSTLVSPKTFHANGDGTFVVDGETRDLRSSMTKWVDYI
jgi:flavin reductase (DIM6/NTAB) family NADH-FMN oxidoreductase RutF